MDVFFADDSSQRGAREGMGQVIAIGGIFVEEAALRPLAAAIDAIAAEAGIPAGTEIKWSPRKDSWIYQKLHGEDRRRCYSRFLEAAIQHRIRALAVCWDTGRTTLVGREAFARCVGYLFERVVTHLNFHDRQAIVVADRPSGGQREDTEFLQAFLDLIENGTQHVDPERVLLNVLTTPSHLVRHLQLADLVTGITTAMVCGAYDYAAPLFPLVRQLLIRNKFDHIGGTGLKVFPDDLVNLYHWVLQEQFLHRGGGAVAYPLPSPKISYASDEMKA
ncbi:MAG TPA: DUF3800 domain-containing protein [Steroidobacteraceae bacterium]|nr:DUF3800 domain-containing protein [Steroidobacteraceae bacterium]